LRMSALVGRVFSSSGSLVRHGQVFLNRVSGNQCPPHSSEKLDKNWRRYLYLRWDRGEGLDPRFEDLRMERAATGFERFACLRPDGRWSPIGRCRSVIPDFTHFPQATSDAAIAAQRRCGVHENLSWIHREYRQDVSHQACTAVSPIPSGPRD